MPFAKEDVLTVARAIADLDWRYEPSGGMQPDREVCVFCDAYVEQNYRNGIRLPGKPMEHTIDCPVLVARDLLTNMK